MMSMNIGASGGLHRHQQKQQTTEEFSAINETQRTRRNSATSTRAGQRRGIQRTQREPEKAEEWDESNEERRSKNVLRF